MDFDRSRMELFNELRMIDMREKEAGVTIPEDIASRRLERIKQHLDGFKTHWATYNELRGLVSNIELVVHGMEDYFLEKLEEYNARQAKEKTELAKIAKELEGKE